MKRPSGYVLYEGPSVLDGQPIVCIATMRTANAKTGPMVQTWILRADMSPLGAGKAGQDASVCGSCPQRRSLGGACYVQLFQGPTAVWRGYQADNYSRAWSSATFRNLLVRLGAYGDPAAVPFEVWERVLAETAGHTGYTHQLRHKRFDRRLLDFVMVSVDTPAQFEAVHSQGLRTFRIKSPDQPLLAHEILCPASDTGTATCATCGLCRGAMTSGPSVATDVHGSLAPRYLASLGKARIPVTEVA